MHSRCACVHGVGGSKGGAVVRALTSHNFGPGSNPGVEAIFGLSLLLVLSFAPRGLSPCSSVFLSPQKSTLPNSNSIRNARGRLNEFIRTPKCFVGTGADLGGGCRGCAPPPPRNDLRFSNLTDILQKKKLCGLLVLK